MAQSQLFSIGIEYSSYVISSRILCDSWSTISSEDIVSNDGEGLSWKVDKKRGSDFMIIAFKATLDASEIRADLVSSSELRGDNFLDFEFLCCRRTPSFSLNRTAISLFRDNHQELDKLKTEITRLTNPSTPLIVTGYGLGGSIASLFVISLLDSIGSKKNRPLCITFGSPLVGDRRLQQAISRSSIWRSCFIHVVSHNDPRPGSYLADRTRNYMPFGRYIYFSYATSFENPESILEILLALASIHDKNEELESVDYGNIVKNLYLKSICIDFSIPDENMTDTDSLAIGISLQLAALGLTPHMQEHENSEINTLETRLKELEERFILQNRMLFDPTRKLNQMKVHMAQLEWYKKETKNQQIGYYDSYKNMSSPFDYNAIDFHKELTKYWEKMVEEAEMKPQKEGAAFRTRWLYGGTTYRRMVEPLSIAKYYSEGGKDYVNNHRSRHFKQLEEWLLEESKETSSDLSSTSKKNVDVILTIDSCFWAHVEDAILLCKELNVANESDETLKKMFEFEEYVYGLLKEYAVSPDIFLAKSSYIRWWNEYKKIKGSTYTSPLVNFMNDDTMIEKYATGAYDFP